MFSLCLPNKLTTQPPVDERIFGLLLAKLIQPNAIPVKVLGTETYKTTAMESGPGRESQDVRMTPERMGKVQRFEEKELVCAPADPATPRGSSVRRQK